MTAPPLTTLTYALARFGFLTLGGSTPPPMEGVPNHWHVYFAVEDADATAGKATELGGSVMVAPFDTPVGRIAILTDPQGAVFSVLKPAPEPES